MRAPSATATATAKAKAKPKGARGESASDASGSEYNEATTKSKKTPKTVQSTKKAATKHPYIKSAPVISKAEAKKPSRKRSISQASTEQEKHKPEPESKKKKDSLDTSLPTTEPASRTTHQQDASSTDPSEKDAHHQDPTIPRSNEVPPKKRFPSPPSESASDFDKEAWQGFCEIESDPGFFSVMVREMGVEGVSLREVYSLDPTCLDTVPSPIYGLILLFRARKVDPENEEASCPPNVWFANQMPGQNSCATLAMINILLNIPGIEIGEHLRQFKEFTDGMTPYQRGETLNSFHFVKKIHNSFAKKQDMLQDDMKLKEKVKHVLHTSANGGGDFNDNAHHFIAFMPIDSEVWKLDGMDAQPTSMGAYVDEDEEMNWL
ncbi:cysteine proteinase, partial [Amniculicola lignicola CBS 123094]